MYSTKGLKIVNGTICVKTKQFGFRSVVGMRVQVMVYEKDKPRFYEGRISAVTSEKVQIKIPSYRPGIDDKNIVLGWKDSWEIIGPSVIRIEPIPLAVSPEITSRCETVRHGIHPKTSQILVLQCVLRLGHAGAHHYENPGNKARK